MAGVVKLVALDPRHAPLHAHRGSHWASMCALWVAAAPRFCRGRPGERWGGRVGLMVTSVPCAGFQILSSCQQPGACWPLLGNPPCWVRSLWGSQLHSRNPTALPGVAFSHLEGRMERRAESWADEKSQSRNALSKSKSE